MYFKKNQSMVKFSTWQKKPQGAWEMHQKCLRNASENWLCQSTPEVENTILKTKCMKNISGKKMTPLSCVFAFNFLVFLVTLCLLYYASCVDRSDICL